MPATTGNEKLCGHCERTLPVSFFYRSAQTPDGLTNWCQGCVRNRNKADYVKRCSGEKPQVTSKECITCKEVKPSEKFGNRKEAWDGKRSYCRECGVRFNRKYNLKKTFGLTLKRYDRILALQNGVCAICNKPPTRKALAVDHDHKTGRVRGLLCEACNRGIGCLGDSAERLIVAAWYLTNRPKRRLRKSL